MAYDQLQKFQGRESQSKTEELFQTEGDWRDSQLNVTCDSDLGPFAIKTIAGTCETWMGPED